VITAPLADTRKPRGIIVKTGETYPQIRERCGNFEFWLVGGLSSVLGRANRAVAAAAVAAKVAVLGVCHDHQLLALGGAGMPPLILL
jgi:hypothetical protein